LKEGLLSKYWHDVILSNSRIENIITFIKIIFSENIENMPLDNNMGEATEIPKINPTE